VFLNVVMLQQTKVYAIYSFTFNKKKKTFKKCSQQCTGKRVVFVSLIRQKCLSVVKDVFVVLIQRGASKQK